MSTRTLIGLIAFAILLSSCGGKSGGAGSAFGRMLHPTETPTAASKVDGAVAPGSPVAAAERSLESGPKAPTSLNVPIPELSAQSIIVMDEDSGAILFERAGHQRMAPASLTKIATAMVVIEAGDLDRVVEVNPDLQREWEEDSSVMGLEPGDRFSVRELLYGMMLVSGNDAAEALMRATSWSEADFVGRMNQLAERIGLHDTHFTEPTGLGGPDHYSTAADLALLSRYAMQNETFREIVGTETHVAKGSRDIDLYNLNPLLNYTAGVDGVKTGYTEQAGRTFVVSAKRDGHRVYAVLLNTTTRAQDAINIIEWSFADHRW